MDHFCCVGIGYSAGNGGGCRGWSGVGGDTTTEEDRRVLADYEEYLDRLNGTKRRSDIGANGFSVIEDQIFPLETACFGEVLLVPAMEQRYHRLVLFL